MARIAIPTKETAPARSQPILANYQKVLGMVPNFFALGGVTIEPCFPTFTIRSLP